MRRYIGLMLRADQETVDKVIGVVVELIESEGYGAVQLRRVAQEAHLSLAKIYKLFPTRDDLLVDTLQAWMAQHNWADLSSPDPSEGLGDALIRVLRNVFEPWRQHPRMLVAYHYALSGVGRQTLEAQAASVFKPLTLSAPPPLVATYVADVGWILTDLNFALIGRVARDEITVEDVLPALERAVRRLTGDNSPIAAATASLWGKPVRAGRRAVGSTRRSGRTPRLPPGNPS